MTLRHERWRITSFGRGVLQRRPLLAMQLAEVSNAWAIIEATLAGFIAFMISEPYSMETDCKRDNLGLKLFAAFKTFNQRWGILRATLESRLAPDEWNAIQKRLKSVKHKIDVAAERRNDLIHSIYGIHVDYEQVDGAAPTASDDGDHLLKSKPYVLAEGVQIFEALTYESIEHSLRTIREARDALDLFVVRIRGRKSEPLARTQAWIERERSKSRKPPGGQDDRSGI
jgi:hypothetical protein